MAKPKAIQWLEEQTGQAIDYQPEGPVGADRHLSVRLGVDLGDELEAMAAERGVKLSQLVRQLLADAVRHRDAAAGLDGLALADRLAADVAEVRRRLAS